jgi:5-dehydro-2-deoxygluconokinase
MDAHVRRRVVVQFDVAALGRIAVDLYGEQKGTSLEDTATFRRYVGGSSGNLAIGCARLGLKTAMISSTGEDPMGRYIRAELAKAGVDNTCVTANPQRRTALAFLGMQRADAIALDFYRDRAADMAVGFGDREAEKVRQSRLLALTGTHMSEPGTADALRKAVETAREAAGKVVLDIDFRKALW